mmetsp:Transcript_30396/g.61205  ORF Transcript_30396/g.61205 Transcript_30396/m.61205 type:complete len:82 (+) Transcript_30396:92-337(+)
MHPSLHSLVSAFRNPGTKPNGSCAFFLRTPGGASLSSGGRSLLSVCCLCVCRSTEGEQLVVLSLSKTADNGAACHNTEGET